LFYLVQLISFEYGPFLIIIKELKMKLLFLACIITNLTNACHSPSYACYCWPFTVNYIVTTNYDFFGTVDQTSTSWRIKPLVKSDFDFDKKPPQTSCSWKMSIGGDVGCSSAAYVDTYNLYLNPTSVAKKLSCHI